MFKDTNECTVTYLKLVLFWNINNKTLKISMKYAMPIQYRAIKYRKSFHRLNNHEFLSKGFFDFLFLCITFHDLDPKNNFFCLLELWVYKTRYSSVCFCSHQKILTVLPFDFKHSAGCVSFLGLMNSTQHVFLNSRLELLQFSIFRLLYNSNLKHKPTDFHKKLLNSKLKYKIFNYIKKLCFFELSNFNRSYLCKSVPFLNSCHIKMILFETLYTILI